MADLTPLYDLDDDVVTLRVQVAPGAGRSAVVGRHGDALKLRVAAPPTQGRANDAAGALLAETFGLKARQVELVAGETSRSKRFRLSGVDVEEFDRALRLLVGPEDRPSGTERRR